MSTTERDIKIPYPTEGVIRSSQLDDTVTPENSVQLAVNANFDRVGAIQTRPGITQYADALTGAIKNFGTLNNSVVPDGYTKLDIVGSDNVLIGNRSSSRLTKIDDTHYLYLYADDTSKGQAIICEIDLNSGVATLLGSPVQFDTAASFISCSNIDANHCIAFWNGSSGKGYTQVIEINLGTWGITMKDSPVQFEASTAGYNFSQKSDANHFINVWTNGSNKSLAQIAEVNLTTWVITMKSTPLEFSSVFSNFHTSSIYSDGLHMITFWVESGLGYSQVLAINNSTWAVTALSTKFNFDGVATVQNGSCASLEDDQHFILFWKGNTGGYAQSFNADPGTFAVTAIGSHLVFDANTTSTHGYSNTCVGVGDGQHFVNSWQNTVSLGVYQNKSQLFSVDLGTFAVTAVGSPYIGNHIFSNGFSVLATPYRVITIYQITNSSPGSTSITVFGMTGVRYYNDFLYAQQANGDVYSWDGANWTSRRTGLKVNNKARFAQFLNYLWMVNGDFDDGDPIATSNGGAFGTDMVPADFPGGDFISAGFEGRVWVVVKATDTIYYTDIVQFAPPSTYSLTFDLSTNFIKNFSPQDGESITALMRVPRALLVFKENHIYRIYGASSVDAYPAYNVGTYSQESIIEAKDGIYFHHSSGFYKFDYGGQPVEISRRIIDFVKAIPATYYKDITGVWDGFDAVKWYVGSVTVEGVTYSNCVLRYTISTQVWTIYDYTDNVITAMISFDDGTTINQIAGTSVGKVVTLDTGVTDLGKSIYYEIIDRWRSFTNMYANSKAISGMNVFTENAGGMSVDYQTEKSPVNEWKHVDTVNEDYNSLFPNASTDDFAVIRFRYQGRNSGVPIVIHGTEILSIQNKGYDQN